MTEQPKKRDSNYDLERAEQKVIAAGHVELADALYDYAQATRNFVMGDYGQQFVTAYETTLAKHIAPLEQSGQTTERILGQVVQLLDEQRDVVKQILASQRNSEKTARQALSASKAVAARLGKLSSEVTALSSAMAESKADRADLRGRIDALTADLEAIKATLAQGDGHAD